LSAWTRSAKHPVARRAKVFASNKKNSWWWLTIVFVLAATAVELHQQGRSWWCSCGRAFLWTGNAWGSLTSQTFLDPYSFTHLLHGLAFCGLLILLVRGLSTKWRFLIAITIEAVWELIENTNIVIQHYRAATAALGYQGDTVLNSLGDIMCCGFGFMIARKLGWLRSLIVFFVTEAVLLIWIRDSLLLEIIMLASPINAIKAWQIGH
jgi:hypothetical protein